MSYKARIWTGLGLFFVGLAAGAVLLIPIFFAIDDDVEALHRFGLRGDGGVYVVDEPQHVWLYLEPQGSTLAGTRFSLIDVATGDAVDLRSTQSYRQTYDMPAGSGRSIARADLEPGEYVVVVEPRNVVIAMGPSPLPGPSTFLLPILIAGPLVVIGLALALISAIQQSRRPRGGGESSLPPPPPMGVPASGGDR